MRFLGALCIAVLVAAPGASRADTNPDAVIALHVTSHHPVGACDTFKPATVPCSGFNTQGFLGTAYDVYIIVGRGATGDPAPGIGGAALGIAYDGAYASGVDVFSWKKCADLEFIGQAWPQSGGSNTLTFAGADHCQRTEVGTDGVHAVLGFFYVYAYDPDELRVTLRTGILNPDLSVADCEGTATYLPDSRAGSARFSNITGDMGYNPCCEGCPPEPPPQDVTPPVLLSGSGAAGSSLIVLSFNEVIGAGATDPANYRVTPGPGGTGEFPIASVSVNVAYVTIHLAAPLNWGVEYTVEVNHVPDLEGNVMTTPAVVSFWATYPDGLAEPKIAAHLGPHTAKNQCTTNAPITLPCEDFTTRGNVGASYDLYVVAVDPGQGGGIAGMSFGVQYDGVVGSGVDVYSWNRCGDLEFAGQGFPQSGGGNTITWDPEHNCQEGRAGENVQAVGGWFYLYAYGEDRFEIVRRVIANPDIRVADCTAREYDLVFPDHAGSVGFGQDGHNPCAMIAPISVEKTTWGGIKRAYGTREKE